MPRTLRVLTAMCAAAALCGCVSGPPMARNLPSGAVSADREFNRRLLARFPAGSPSDGVISALGDEGFQPSRARNLDPSTHVYAFEREAFPCSFAWNVFWTSDARGRVTDISGTYDAIC